MDGTRCRQVIQQRGGVSARIAENLMQAGFRIARELRNATDEELLAVEGVGESTLIKIRAWVGG